MRIVFEYGTSQECSPTDQREIIAEAGFHPVQNIPKRLKRVSDNPPAWANLVVVRCSVIVPDHYVMTSAGLKRVARVERKRRLRLDSLQCRLGQRFFGLNHIRRTRRACRTMCG